MSRSRIGFCLMAVLLVLGVLTQRYMTSVHEPISRALQDAAESALSEDWPRATAAGSDARQRWERSHAKVAALADHEPMEDIDSLFARLEAYAREQDTGEYAAACRELARRIDAMSDAHKLTWSNVF